VLHFIVFVIGAAAVGVGKGKHMQVFECHFFGASVATYISCSI